MIKEWKELYFDGTELVDPYELAERIYRENENVLPDRSNLFKAFELTKPQDVKVVIIGQDPYHTPGQAQGLSFSLPNDAPTQPSLKNILKELEADTGIKRKETDLTSWANQGVLLLNSALTVLQGQPGAHKNMGWNLFTKKIVEIVDKQPQPIVFILWGKHAQEYELYIKNKHVIKSPHPSPFSARKGFFGSKPFTKTNQYLVENGSPPIDWSK